MGKTKSRTSSLTVPSLSRDVGTANVEAQELPHLVPHQMESELRAHTLALDAKLQEISSLKQQHDSLLGTLELGVVATNSTGRVISINAMAEKLLGTPRQHLIGQSLSQAWQANGLPDVPFSSIRHGDRFLTSYDQMRPAPGPRGHGGIRILKDVTMLTTLQGQLANQQRLAVMGEMIGTIAHEIRNPLASIELFASLLGTSIQDDAERQTLAKQIARVVRSLDHVLSNLLLMTKNVAPNFQPVPLETMVHDVIMMGMHAIRERSVSVSENLRNSPRLICVDEPLFKQALLNLLLNAIQSSPENGVVEVSSRWASIDTSREGLAGNPAREAMVVSVRDNGCGIRKEDQERMFEPFFSKRHGGTGLGLVRQIMDVHQGWVECESTPGEGTTIALWVPQGREGS